jgi:hypothetical protein
MQQCGPCLGPTQGDVARAAVASVAHAPPALDADAFRKRLGIPGLGAATATPDLQNVLQQMSQSSAGGKRVFTDDPNFGVE